MQPLFDLRGCRLFHGDNRQILKTVDDNSIDACVCDPPYDLTAASRGGSPRQNDPNTPFGRTRLQSTGFMGKAWDGTGIAFDPAFWAEVLRVMSPGARLLAFGGTRTFHRMFCAIEDAGFELVDCLQWVYASGMPKGQSCLKPSWEPITLARKKRSPVNNLNIDACRIEHNGDKLGGGRISTTSDGWDRPWKHDEEAIENCKARGEKSVAKAEMLGRYPANTILDGSDEVVAMFPQTTSGDFSGHRNKPKTKNAFGAFQLQDELGHVGDSGSASRFFFSGKASRTERGDGNNHPAVKPQSVLRWLVKLITPVGGTVLDPFLGSGSTALACIAEGFQCIGIEQELDYLNIAKRRIDQMPTTLFT